MGDGRGDRERNGLCGTLNGIFRSVDRGATWESSALAGQWINQVVGRSGASAVYARAAGELHAIRDGGETWHSRSVERELVAVDPVEASTVYAGWMTESS